MRGSGVAARLSSPARTCDLCCTWMYECRAVQDVRERRHKGGKDATSDLMSDGVCTGMYELLYPPARQRVGTGRACRLTELPPPCAH